MCIYVLCFLCSKITIECEDELFDTQFYVFTSNKTKQNDTMVLRFPKGAGGRPIPKQVMARAARVLQKLARSMLMRRRYTARRIHNAPSPRRREGEY